MIPVLSVCLLFLCVVFACFWEGEDIRSVSTVPRQRDLTSIKSSVMNSWVWFTRFTRGQSCSVGREENMCGVSKTEKGLNQSLRKLLYDMVLSKRLLGYVR